MKTKLLTSALLLICVSVGAQQLGKTGSAPVSGTSGRTSCEYVQLWEAGPRWATFNVGAIITDYADLRMGKDNTEYLNNESLAEYYNTANVGGLYAWYNPNLNGRQTTWTKSVEWGIGDVATTLWGRNWETPTRLQLDTLCNSILAKTTWTWCDGISTQYVDGCPLSGYKITGVDDYADQSIFLPAAGYFDYFAGKIGQVSEYGSYWSDTMEESSAYSISIYSDTRRISDGLFYDGSSIRAVLADDYFPSAIICAEESLPATTKSIRDGQLIITRDGKEYNAQGTRL